MVSFDAQIKFKIIYKEDHDECNDTAGVLFGGVNGSKRFIAKKAFVCPPVKETVGLCFQVRN